MITAALGIIAKMWKQPMCKRTHEWIKKTVSIHTMQYYSAIKREKIMPGLATGKKVEITIRKEVSETGKDKYDIFSRWLLQMGTYELLYQRKVAS